MQNFSNPSPRSSFIPTMSLKVITNQMNNNIIAVTWGKLYLLLFRNLKISCISVREIPLANLYISVTRNYKFRVWIETLSEMLSANRYRSVLKATSATKRWLLKMWHLRHRLITFLFHRNVMFRSRDIQVFVFLTIPWFTKFVTSRWVLVYETGCIFEYIFWTTTH